MFRLHRSCSRQIQRGFTLIELLVVIAIIGLIMALLFPTLVAARRKAHQSVCISNEHQIGKAFDMYLADYDGKWYSITDGRTDIGWGRSIEPYTKVKPDQLACPDARISNETKHFAVPGYATNHNLIQHGGVENAKIQYPALTVSVLDAPWNYNLAGVFCWDPWIGGGRPDPAPEEAWKRHQDGADYLFCDWHVKWYAPSAVECGPNGFGERPGFEIYWPR